MTDSANTNKSLIREFFSDEMLKKIYYHATRTDIADNNEKAVMLQELLGPTFVELGTGTNRMSFLHNGMVVKIALDYRGMIDSFTEFKRSEEAPQYLAHTYECNMLIAISQYLNLMDQSQFVDNKEGILAVLEELSKAYIFDDIGFTTKNFENWGYDDDGNIKVLDYGYMYPRRGQEEALTCPQCMSLLKYNSLYTSFKCSNDRCKVEFRPMEIRRRMRRDLEDLESRTISMLNQVSMPDFNSIIIK